MVVKGLRSHIDYLSYCDALSLDFKIRYATVLHIPGISIGRKHDLKNTVKLCFEKKSKFESNPYNQDTPDLQFCSLQEFELFCFSICGDLRQTLYLNRTHFDSIRHFSVRIAMWQNFYKSDIAPYKKVSVRLSPNIVKSNISIVKLPAMLTKISFVFLQNIGQSKPNLCVTKL